MSLHTASPAGDREQQLWALFDACLELEPEACAQLLEQQTDVELVGEVERLLRADAAAVDLSGIAGQALAQLVATPPTIEGFTVLRQLGAGGFGTVYLALQHRPSRRVALKVLNAGIADPSEAERFRVEGNALALLAHPHVPKVFAVGETEGRRWLAMEFVRGEALDVWAQGQPVPRRLAALEAVARAVHGAHLRGLVHRDLKPENVLVTRDGSPRVLDFGIAQSVGEAGPAAGTRAYMSPEQRRGEPVDGRADVYALGVMLSELATSAFAPRRLASNAARSTALVDEPTALGAQEPLTSARAAPLVAELESIAARATASLDERYASAEALAEDLRRFQTGARVHAHPATWLYRLRCGVRQNRGLVLALALVFVGLATAAGLFRSQYEVAELERARADATSTFLRATLVQANPLSGSGPRVTVVEAVDAAARRLDEGALEMNPVVELELRETLATTYASLGRELESWHQSKRAVEALARGGIVDPELEARLLRNGADYAAHSGEIDGALEWLAREGALEAHHQRPHLHLAQHGHMLGEVLMDAGRFAQAITVLEEAIVQLEALHRAGSIDVEEYTSTLNQQGHALTAVGRFAEARARFELALQIDTREQGTKPLELATDVHNLAWLALREGRLDEALAKSSQARALRLEKLGPGHLRMGLLRLLDGEALARLGRCAEGLPLVQEGATILGQALGPDSTRALRGDVAVGQVELLCGLDALARVRRASERLEARMGDTQWWVLEGRLTEARALIAAGSRDAGTSLAAQLAPKFEDQLGVDAPLTKLARSTAQGD